MKKAFLQATLLIVIVLSLSWISGCNSGSEKKTEDKTTFNQEAFNQQIQGVYEYLPPMQGLAALFNNHYIFIYGDSDTTMVSNTGTYTTSGDTVICTIQFASNPNLIGSVFKWSAHFMENDSFKAVLFDESGNVTSEIYNSRKTEVDENTLSQMKEWEGFYNYLPPIEGSGILLGGYLLWTGGTENEMVGDAFTYKYQNDTVICKRLFSTNPDMKGQGLTWVIESMSGDTLNWASIDDEGEVLSRGKSLY